MAEKKQRALLTFTLITMIILFIVSVSLFVSRNWVNMTSDIIFTASADICCMFFISMFFYGASKSDLSNRRSRTLLNMIVIIFVAVVTDMFAMLMQGLPQNRDIAYALQIVLLIMINVCSLSFYFFARAVVEAKKPWGKILAIIWFIIANVIYITNPLHHLMFEIDASGTLITYKGYNIYMVYPIIVQISALVLAYKYEIPKRQKFVFYAFNIIPLGLSILFNRLFGPNVVFVGMTASLIICYNVFFIDLERENNSLKESFERFLSDDVVERLIDKTSGELNAPQLQMATIMNVDIRGFTAISQRLYPAKLVDMINHYFGVMNDIVENNEGIVLEFLGDGFTAIFGAPVYVRNYPERAVAAALQMQNALVAINEWNEKKGYPEIEIGIGINTGEVILGSFGSESKASYKAIGEEADFCSYIESLTFGGSVLISESTLNELHAENDAKCIFDVDPQNCPKDKGVFSIHTLGEPYNLNILKPDEKLIQLKRPYPITFKAFKGKSISDERYEGFITHISNRILRIETSADIGDSHEIDLSNKNYNYLYAKKIETIENGIQYILISKPGDFIKWYNKVLDYGNSEVNE